MRSTDPLDTHPHAETMTTTRPGKNPMRIRPSARAALFSAAIAAAGTAQAALSAEELAKIAQNPVGALVSVPAQPGPVGLISGAGAIAQIPTNTDDLLGNKNWGLGPTAVVLKLEKGNPWVGDGSFNRPQQSPTEP
jgi:hypothetical protein